MLCTLYIIIYLYRYIMYIMYIGKGRLAVCVNQEPWQDYCVEPPCGQLNPVNPNVYTTLGKYIKKDGPLEYGK